MFPISTPINASFILIFRIDAIAEAVHVPVVGSGIPTNSIIPNIDTCFIFFIPECIFLSILFNNFKNIPFSFKNCIICLNVNTSGTDTIVDPITLAIYTPIRV